MEKKFKAMIKGILAFISSGALLNPMILLGVVSGLIFGIWLKLETIKEIYGSYHFYLLVMILSVAYNFIFNQVCKEHSVNLDYKAMTWNIVTYFIKFVMANALTISFVYMMKP